jgi:hypothetical protein
MSDPKVLPAARAIPSTRCSFHFPLRFFAATFVCDPVYWQTSNNAWAVAGDEAHRLPKLKGRDRINPCWLPCEALRVASY